MAKPTRLPKAPRSFHAVVKRWEAAAGYDAMWKDEITDSESLRDVLKRNQRWLEEHFEEKIRVAGNVASNA